MTSNLKHLEALIKLGDYLRHFNGEEKKYQPLIEAIAKAKIANSWFTQETVHKVIKDWGNALIENRIVQWLNAYTITSKTRPKQVAIILAGNIPMVGFHDLICVWLSGHHAIVKCASKDTYLLPFMTQFLEQESGETCFQYTTEPFKKFDAVIATGSNNSGRYFEHYFGTYPHIIRKNRNGVAVLEGTESKEDFLNLGNDIMQYFGLGCRNVSKVYLPESFDLDLLFGGLYPHAEVIQHAKYANNYDYNKAVFLMSEFDFLENGFFMLKKDPSFSAPIACLHYEYYQNIEDLTKELQEKSEQIQCIVSNRSIPNAIPFGKAQQPELNDYADGIDTLAFLESL